MKAVSSVGGSVIKEFGRNCLSLSNSVVSAEEVKPRLYCIKTNRFHCDEVSHFHLCPGLNLIRCTPNFDIQHKVSL